MITSCVCAQRDRLRVRRAVQSLARHAMPKNATYRQTSSSRRLKHLDPAFVYDEQHENTDLGPSPSCLPSGRPSTATPSSLIRAIRLWNELVE